MNNDRRLVKRSSAGIYECPFCNEAIIMNGKTYNFCAFCGKRVKTSTNKETRQTKNKTMTKLREAIKDFDVYDALALLECFLGVVCLFCFDVLIARIVCVVTGWQLGLCLCISTAAMLAFFGDSLLKVR